MKIQCRKMFKVSLKYFIVLFASLQLCHGISTPSSPTYRAGVVEFKTPEFKYFNETSVNEYVNLINLAAKEDVDILVFPEMTLNSVFLTTYVPGSWDKTTPCNNVTFAAFLSEISCAARSTKTYIVVNVIEKEDCTAESQENAGDSRPCASNGFNQYNTNVVFDRDGTVISRYRKWNLYGEPGKNTTLEPEYGMFNTDFGVKFGHFICFDILFYTPANELVDLGIHDFIFPTMWFSELPFLTAVQIQASWAYANNVNLLAAGANRASVGSTGTGIYAGQQGRIVGVMRSDPINQLFVAEVPKKGEYFTVTAPGANIVGSENIFFKRDNLEIYNTTILPIPRDGNFSKTICHNWVCCKVFIQTTGINVSPNAKKFVYRSTFFDGNRTYGVDGVESRLKVCGIISCLNESLSSCGMVHDKNEMVVNDFWFQSIVIEAEFSSRSQMLIMPNSLDFTYMPLNVNEFEFDNQKLSDRSSVTFTLKKPKSNLLTFAIYVNVMDNSNGISLGANIFVIISLNVILYYFK